MWWLEGRPRGRLDQLIEREVQRLGDGSGLDELESSPAPLRVLQQPQRQPGLLSHVCLGATSLDACGLDGGSKR